MSRAAIVFGCKYQMRGTSRHEVLLQDLGYALRQLRKSPGFNCGCRAHACSGDRRQYSYLSMDGILLRPLPYPHSDRIMFLAESTEQVQDESFSMADLSGLAGHQFSI